MSLLNMWNVFEKTGNIEAYLYDKINRDSCGAEDKDLGLRDGGLNTPALQQKDGTEG